MSDALIPPTGWMPVTVSIALRGEPLTMIDVPGWVRTSDAPLAITQRPIYFDGTDDIVLSDTYTITHRGTGLRVISQQALAWAEAEALHDALIAVPGVDWARIDTNNPMALAIARAALADAGIKPR